jgi:hypothetical protein
MIKELMTDVTWWPVLFFIGACMIMITVFAFSISGPDPKADWEFVKTYKPNKKKIKSRRKK